MDQARIAGFAERSVDGEQDFPIREFVIKLYLRKWVFLLCLVIPGLLALTATALTPMTWTATTKILIRYSSSESVFLKDLIPDDRASLSGAAIGEILRSLPTLAETIRRYDIHDDDLYRDPSKVLFGKLASLLPSSSSTGGPATEELPGIDPKTTALAKTFQDSLEESAKASASALGSKTRPVELLGKDSTLPQSMKGDELITLTVRSFNRTKVAAMTNGLAQTFIDQYYQLAAEDAHRSFEFLSLLAEQSAAEIQQLEQDPNAPVAAATTGGNGTLARDSPAIAKLTNDLATLEASLGRSQQFYRDNSTQIQRTQAEIDGMKRLLAGQERLEVAKAVLQQIKARRFQALNTENLYRNRLVPISIVEPAITPTASGSAAIIRLVSSGITGMLIGGVLGVALIIIFGLMDQRLFTPTDAERALGLPVFGWLPKLRVLRRRRGRLPDAGLRLPGEVESGLLQALAQLDAAGAGKVGHVVALASVSDGDGKSLVCLLLAKALARSGRSRVLLIDADPLRASLTAHFGQQKAAGLVDAAIDGRSVTALTVPSGVPQLDLLAAGSVAERETMGFYLRRLHKLFDEARGLYDLVIVDTPSVANSSQALMCCMAVDTVLVVVKSGATRKFQIRGFLRKLQEVAVRPRGVILNFRNSLLPRFIDGGA